ncbi:NUDIX domain-containing protein [Streptomyces sp. BBFR2]|uniref:NUDIX domain-containing protein n=1 Tax=Streptomyces sp. BBFR2 TaxID=3372854 RepID=UPI0037D99FE5
MTTMDEATYIASLPRVLSGAGTVLRDAAGRILLVEPDYRDCWLLPGGTVESDTGESPREAARRETAEEIGLDLPLGPLLAVDWVRSPGWPPVVSYLFDGGVLDEAALASIRLQEDELLSWRMAPWEEAARLLDPQLALRVRAALDALERGTGTVELEDGRVPGSWAEG